MRIFFSQSRHRNGNYAEYNDFSENEEWIQKMLEFFKFNLSKYLFLLLFLGSCHSSSSYEKSYLVLGHSYDWQAKENNRLDPRIEQIDVNQFDRILIGGDLCARTSEDSKTLDYVDEVLHISKPTTYWAVGNHDIDDGNSAFIKAKTKRDLSYTTSFDNLCLLVLNTTLFYHPSYSPTSRECELVEKQTKLIQNIADTISEASHLIILHHHCLLTNDMTHKKYKLNHVFNYYHPEVFADCQQALPVNEVYFPYFRQIQKKGIQVVMISGDIGQRVKSFEYTTDDGIIFLGSGINNSCGKDIKAPWVTNLSPDKILILKYNLLEEKLTWEYIELNTFLSL